MYGLETGRNTWIRDPKYLPEFVSRAAGLQADYYQPAIRPRLQIVDCDRHGSINRRHRGPRVSIGAGQYVMAVEPGRGQF